MERTYLFVPFNEKEEAKALGARFDAQRKAWYVPDHLDLSSFKRWVEPPRALTEQEIHDQFTQALEAAGLVVSGIVQMDGQWHKTTVSTSRNTKALKGAYRCEIVDGAARGFIANHDTGERRPWFPEGTMLSSKVLEHHRQLLNENRRQREQNEHTTHEDVAVHIGKKWETLAPDDHPYLKRKQVEAFGLRREGHLLVTPLRDADGKIWSLQYISDAEKDNKRYEKNGRKTGHFHVLGNLNASQTILFGEGYATCASLHMATSLPVVEVFDGGNISPVLRNLVPRLNGKTLIICGDDDVITDKRILKTLNATIASDDAKTKLLLSEVSADEVIIDGEMHALRANPDCFLRLTCEAGTEGVQRIVGEFSNRASLAKVPVKILNLGREKALAAAAEHHIKALFPTFQSLVGSPTDFNDLHVREGLPVVRRQISLALLMELSAPSTMRTPTDIAREVIGETTVVKYAKENGQYVGPIIGQAASQIVQNVGRQTAIIHDSKQLDTAPKTGQTVRIQYIHGKGQIFVQEKARDRSIER
ncbi:Putative DNA primase traC [Candidatus Glomeribacter gigasporarum BEG34]|uniref:Putative DNA primase traC n=1 Tax=Candidatus Glomeribacter gigasporarum BEG34 TaxID=1070319 RepID=G2J998_9BURK|nr:DUF5710 domain-containing protein [Candidatus Glomeribacter gigasporarum]CCD29345.1 Putative DNA primase traC [Candidatus Glomeribacter gigasporarum BEG34]